MAVQAFEGIKIADFGWILVEPTMVKYLADHGAEVIRVESRTRLDVTRVSAPYKDDVAGPNRAGFFTTSNSNKYGMTLNLKHPRGSEVARKIVAWADIVSEGYTPGTMQRWGLGYEELTKIKPDIIMISTCNLGQTGPYASHPGFGTQLVGYSGLASITGWADGAPVIPDTPYTDALTPIFGAAALIAALDYRRQTGKGQYLDLSQHEAAVYSLAPLVLDFMVNRRVAQRTGNRCSYAAPHGVYPCRGEDRWCAIAVFTDEEWQSFSKVVGEPPWARGPRFATLAGRKEHEDELDELVGEWTRWLTAEQVMAMMQAAGVAAGVVQTCEDIYHDPQLKHRHHFQQLEHPEIGRHSYQLPPYRLSETPAELRMPAPCLGQHNEYVYTKILGMSDEEFIELVNDGVFE
jgi:benzylsuccinate CoA-transferase BbsF subunit